MAKEKTGLASLSEGRTDIHWIDPHKLNVRIDWNARDFGDPSNQLHIEQLSLSIAEIGVKEPLTVIWEGDKAWVIDGECRLRAALRAIDVHKAPIKTVPVKSEVRYANEAEQLFSQVVRNSGKPFSQMENAKVFKRLLDLGWQQNDIAKKAGVTPARVSQILDLLAMPEPIKQMVTNGQVSASMAVATLKEHNPGRAVEVLKDAVAVANSEGSQRAMPKHVEVPAAPKPPAGKRSLGLEKVVFEAFEYADIDDSDQEIVVIKLPMEQWENIRKVLKL
jgi:ParB family chromosome partitioning protein